MKNKVIVAIILIFSFNFANMAQYIQVNNSPNNAWLDSLITKRSIGKNPITNIKSYTYKNEPVYLVNFDAGCCDQYSAVLKDKNGKTISHPFGGISGKGDMQAIDFTTEKSNEILIWINENPSAIPFKKEKSFKMEKSDN